MTSHVEIDSHRQYLERVAAQSRDRVLRHMRSMLTALEKADSAASERPAVALHYHEDMQQTILWNTWNSGLAELLHAGHMLAAFDQQYPREPADQAQ